MPRNHLLFRPTSCFGMTKITTLDWKIMKMCEQIFKKRQRPNTIQILWIVKNQERANNSLNYRFAAFIY